MAVWGLYVVLWSHHWAMFLHYHVVNFDSVPFSDLLPLHLSWSSSSTSSWLPPSPEGNKSEDQRNHKSNTTCHSQLHSGDDPCFPHTEQCCWHLTWRSHRSVNCWFSRSKLIHFHTVIELNRLTVTSCECCSSHVSECFRYCSHTTVIIDYVTYCSTSSTAAFIRFTPSRDNKKKNTNSMSRLWYSKSI